LGICSSSTRCTWPAHRSLGIFIAVVSFCSLYIAYNSRVISASPVLGHEFFAVLSSQTCPVFSSDWECSQH
jgi:hypothetical protein